jgi:hypothetical protein
MTHQLKWLVVESLKGCTRQDTALGLRSQQESVKPALEFLPSGPLLAEFFELAPHEEIPPEAALVLHSELAHDLSG